MWSGNQKSRKNGMYSGGHTKSQKNHQIIGSSSNKTETRTQGGGFSLELMVKNKEPNRDFGSSGLSRNISFSMLNCNEKAPNASPQQSRELPPPSPTTTAGNNLMIFGQTEWSRLWADKIYQFSSTPPAKVTCFENRDANCQRVLCNPEVASWASLSPAEVQNCGNGVSILCDNGHDQFSRSNWMNGNGRKRFETGKVRRDAHGPIQKYGNGRPPVNEKVKVNTRTIRNQNQMGSFYDKGSLAESDTMGSSNIGGRVANPRPRFTLPSSNDCDERRIQRKMRFENNVDPISDDVTGAGAGPLEKKKRISMKQIRSIVIDGTNVAYDYGERWCFDWEGIHMCAKYFKDFGCDDIIVVVPEARMERGMTRNFELAEPFKKDNKLWGCWANTNYKQFIAKTADRKNAVIISNEMWKQPNEISANLRHLVDKTIGFSFNANSSPKNLVISERPFGPSGPTLDELLRL